MALPVQPVVDYGAMMSSLPMANAQIQNFAATRALTQQQTEAAKIGNERSQVQLDYMQQLMQSMAQPANDAGAPPAADAQSAVPGGQPAAPEGTTSTAADSGADSHTSIEAAGMDPAHITAHVQQQYAVKDIWSPQELTQLKLATVSGIPGAAELLKQQHDARIHNAMAKAQLGASNAYDTAYAVSTAPGTNALATLRSISPQAADSLDKLAKHHKWSDDQTDQFTRMYADELGNAVHRYSGRDTEVGTDGITRDKETHQPLLNANPVGLSANESADLSAKGSAIVRIPEGDHEVAVQQWQADGAPSLEVWKNRMAIRDRARAAAAQNAQGAAGTKPGAAPGAAKPTAATAADPQLQQALNDPAYKLDLPKQQFGKSEGKGAVNERDAITAKRTAVLEGTGDNAKISGAALTYLNAAKAIIDNGGATTGLGADVITNVNRLARQFGMKGGLTADPSQNIALVKNLVNAGLQNIKATFGPRVTANEVFLNLNKANPSAEMPVEALRSLINENRDIAKYDVDTAQRARAYLAPGNNMDPRSFDTWNQVHFPKEAAVAIAKGPPADGAGKPMPSPQKLIAYAHANFGGDIARARLFLKQHGYK